MTAAQGALTGAAYILRPISNFPSDQHEEIIKGAYRDAIAFHQRQFSLAEGTTWLDKPTSMQDVLDILLDAQSRYAQQTTKSSKYRAAMTSWWKVAATRMMHYERVIDTIVSSRAEYAAPVWGAMKFLFTVSANRIYRIVES